MLLSQLIKTQTCLVTKVIPRMCFTNSHILSSFHFAFKTLICNRLAWHSQNFDFSKMSCFMTKSLQINFSLIDFSVKPLQFANCLWLKRKLSNGYFILKCAFVYVYLASFIAISASPIEILNSEENFWKLCHIRLKSQSKCSTTTWQIVCHCNFRLIETKTILRQSIFYGW